MSGIEFKGDKSIEDVLSECGIYASVTKGGSMLPLFRTGRDVVYIAPAARPLKKYDVILFRVGDRYVLHRIIRFTDSGYICRGDNNFFTETVSHENLVGVLIRYHRNGKSYDTDTARFRIRGALRGFSYPVRLVLRKARRLCGRLIRKIKGGKNG
ncbi:MAG: S26 family signal peptidase [Clostridia bacterium]|nr:S26 family signal peptidase [Clostridia bacterium]